MTTELPQDKKIPTQFDLDVVTEEQQGIVIP